MARTSYGTGQATFGGSVLVQADNFAAKLDNALALKATLANANGTPVFGMRSVEVSWDMLIDNDGPEVAWFSLVMQGAIAIPIGFTFPQLGVDATFTVAAGTGNLTQKLGDPGVVACTAKGSVSGLLGI